MIDHAALYEAFLPKVSAYVRSRIPESDREDVVSDVFVKVCAALPGYDESRASLSTWIYAITRNTVIDYFRRRRPDALSLNEELAASQLPPSLDDALERLADALEALPEAQRDVVILHFHFGMSHREIAQRKSMSYAYVRKLHSLAMQALRQRLTL